MSSKPIHPTAATGIHAVLFDYGMVLSGPPLPSAWAHMLTLTGLDEPAFQAAYWAHRHAYDRGTHTGEQYWQLVTADALAPQQIQALIAADNDLWTELNPPMIAWVHRLHRARIRTGILSNLGDHMSAGVINKFDWIRNFDHAIWSHTLKLAKPERAIYQHSADGLHTAPENILFIDDRADNIAAALDFGMQAIRYSTHGLFEREMQDRGFGALLHPAIP